MSDATLNTASNAGAVQAAPGATTGQQSTNAAGDSAASVGVQQRIDGLTAQIGRKDTKIQELETKLNALAEASKSEQQKLIDAAAEERLKEFKAREHEPLATSAEHMKGALQAQINLYKEKLPEAKRALFEALPIVEQLNAYQTLVGELTGQQTVSVGAGVNPPEARAKTRIAGSEFRAWQQTNHHDPKQRELYESQREIMQSAYTEKRIDWER